MVSFATPDPSRSFGLDSGARPFPTLDRAFDAVDAAFARLGFADPATLRSPRPVEEALAPRALPGGALLILDPDELARAEEDVLETLRDERSSGTVFAAIPDRLALISLRRSLREVAAALPSFLFAAEGALPNGFSRLTRVVAPAWLRRYRVLVADTAGFRVAVVSRRRADGGYVGLWSGDPDVVNEVTTVLRDVVRAAGHVVPSAAPEVPALDGITSEADVWRQAADLRGQRVSREAELREIARAAALRGVALRRERAAS